MQSELENEDAETSNDTLESKAKLRKKNKDKDVGDSK